MSLSGKKAIDLGAQLYQLLPAVFRDRDNPVLDKKGKILEQGDLAKLLAVQGELLDKFYRTLLQRYYDTFPDQEDVDAEGLQRSCQPWLLPYIGRLFDVKIHSPDEAGQRAEVTNAVAWRQCKGTLVGIEQIAQEIGRFEVEIQEGWQRVITTARVDDPLLPAGYFGEAEVPAHSPPQVRALHPGLKNATPDLRRPSKTVQCDANNPAAHHSIFNHEAVSWRQLNRHGAPCFPGTYQDRTPRTVDIRTSDYRRGHTHPRHILLYIPPAEGFFAKSAPSISWPSIAGKEKHTDELIEISTSDTFWNGKKMKRHHYRGLTAVLLKIRGVVDLNAEAVYCFENLWLDNRLDLKKGKVELYRCASRLTLVQTPERFVPVIEAKECLFRHVEAARGQIQLEYCTVLDRLVAEWLNASDCILLKKPQKDRKHKENPQADKDVPAAGCIRFSALPEIPPDEMISDGELSELIINKQSCTHKEPIFFEPKFGQPGCGVLHPQTELEIRFGAEDGGEMGGYHGHYYCLRQEAVRDKLNEHLPVGMKAVLIPDRTLGSKPPEIE